MKGSMANNPVDKLKALITPIDYSDRANQRLTAADREAIWEKAQRVGQTLNDTNYSHLKDRTQ